MRDNKDDKTNLHKPTVGETTSGGSTIYQYTNEARESEIGVDGSPGFEEREDLYDKFFGNSEYVYHESMPVIPHIDIYAYEPGYKDRDFWTIVTSGMSNKRMNVPDQLLPEYSRAELIFYCDEPKQAYIDLLRSMAHFPHDNNSWFGHGHTIPNGNPPTPLFFKNSPLTTLLFLGTIVSPDDELSKHLSIEGDPVNFLWPIPISDEECNFKLNKGTDALLDLFVDVNHPVTFKPSRKSYI